MLKSLGFSVVAALFSWAMYNMVLTSSRRVESKSEMMTSELGNDMEKIKHNRASGGDRGGGHFQQIFNTSANNFAMSSNKSRNISWSTQPSVLEESVTSAKRLTLESRLTMNSESTLEVMNGVDPPLTAKELFDKVDQFQIAGGQGFLDWRKWRTWFEAHNMPKGSTSASGYNVHQPFDVESSSHAYLKNWWLRLIRSLNGENFPSYLAGTGWSTASKASVDVKKFTMFWNGNFDNRQTEGDIILNQECTSWERKLYFCADLIKEKADAKKNAAMEAQDAKDAEEGRLKKAFDAAFTANQDIATKANVKTYLRTYCSEFYTFRKNPRQWNKIVVMGKTPQQAIEMESVQTAMDECRDKAAK